MHQKPHPLGSSAQTKGITQTTGINFVPYLAVVVSIAIFAMALGWGWYQSGLPASPQLRSQSVALTTVMASRLPGEPNETAEPIAAIETAKTANGTEKKLPKTISFNAHIRPIMSDTCFTCHGPDADENESSLRLDSFEAAVEEGEAIVPGNSAASLVYEKLMDADDPMPPKKFRHQLSDYDKALFKKWIEQGAKYESHWAWSPLKRPEPPTPIQADDAPRLSSIDAFIFAKLDSEGFTFSPLADKATLLRRVSLDLIGLPPTPAELAAFVNDVSPDAYEKVVERLLASPHYGERMASQWLDIVRFSDTVGFHGDQNQRVFPYRDYVINSLNANKPFDQFTREQIAGDLLEDPTDEQLIATGLIRLNMMTREGGAQPEEYLAKYAADRVRMLGTAFLGLTTGCCECHNHKYDPLTAKDFYSLGAFFDDIRQWGVYTTHGYTPNPDLGGFNNDSPFPPEIRTFSKSAMAQIEHLESRLTESIASQSDHDKTFNSPEFAGWLKSLSKELHKNKTGWQPLQIKKVATVSKSTTHQTLDDGSVLLRGKPQSGDKVTLTGQITSALPIKSICLEVLPHDSNDGFVGRSPEGRFTASLTASIQIGASTKKPTTRNMAIERIQVDRLNPNRYHSGSESAFLEGNWRSGPALWQVPVDETKLPHTAVFHLSKPESIQPGDELTITLNSNDVGCVRVSTSPLTRFVAAMPSASENLLVALQQFESGKALSPASRATLLSTYYLATTPAGALTGEVKTYRDQIAECRSGYAMSTIVQQSPPDRWQKSRVLPRGDWQDTSGEVVAPATPAYLPQLLIGEKRRLNRLDLANWLTSDENPLVARHYVNRTWKHFFGAGLSNKLDDLGNQGEWPSHPELLDWLAAEFRSNWDMKAFARMIVLSNTYQQAAAVSSRASEIDPYNRLLSQQSPRRLEAEVIRDNALAIAGLLNINYIGGPSVFPYQPDGYYSNIQFPNRKYVNSPLDLQYRRGVYMHWQRTFLHPMLTNFDAPSRDECAADRVPSNSPQQALTLLNDPEFVEASKAFATQLLTDNSSNDFETRLKAAYQRALARAPSKIESDGLKAFFEQQTEFYRESESDTKLLLTQNGNFIPPTSLDQIELAAWTQVCRVILNLHETITRY